MELTDQTYKIVSLTIENIKRLSVVQIDTNGNPIIIIGGENTAGKSSVLDSIEMVLAGLDSACKEPVHHGTGKARIVLDLGDIIVTRKFVEGKISDSVLEVKSKAGARFASPQTMLDKLIGSLSFDPLEFERKDPREPKKQERILRELAGIKTDDIEKAYDKSFQERTDVNRSVKTLEAQFTGYHHYPSAPAEEVSIADLTRELEAANETVRALDKARESHGLAAKDLKAAYEAVRHSEKVVESLGVQVQDLERELRDVKRSLETEDRKLIALKGSVQENEGAVQTAIDEGLKVRAAVIDAAPIKTKIEAAEGVNRQVRANETYNGLKQALDEEKATAQRLTDELEALLKEKAARLAAAKFPIEGLAIDDRGVVFNGVPFDQASQAERIRVSVAISAALNPKLRVILIREGSLLDSKSMKLLAELATEHDLQIWVEKVAESKEGVTVLIEDGAVKQDTPVTSGFDWGIGPSTVVFDPSVPMTDGLGNPFPAEPAQAPARKKQGNKKSQEAA